MTRRSIRTRPLHETHAGPVRVGLLLRMSTARQEDSIEKQREHATAALAAMVAQLAPGRGYLIVAEWADAAVSRAEYVRRPGFIAMMAAVERGEIDVVVTRDSERFGGDSERATMAMLRLQQRGAVVYFYRAQQFADLGSPSGKLIATIQNTVAEWERATIADRTHEALERMARAGLNVGGRVYGYGNVRRDGRVEYVIDPTEARVVVSIFERFIAGWGLRRIARDLTARSVPAPRKRWTGSTIGSMLDRHRYLGVIEWGRVSKGVYVEGTKTRVKNRDEDCVRVERPELRIVPQELWDAVQARRATNTRAGLQPGGERAAAKSMLVGLSRCSECGSPMRGHRRGAAPHYVCAARREHGTLGCPSTVARPTSAVDAVVIDWVRREILSEEVVSAIMSELRNMLRARLDDRPAEAGRLVERRSQLAAQRDRLGDAIQFGDTPPRALVERLAAVERDLADVERALAVTTAASSTVEAELDRLEAAALGRLRELDAALDAQPDAARAALRALFPSGIVMRPVPGRRGKARLQVEGDARALGAVVLHEAPTPGGAAKCLSANDPKGT